MTVRTGYDRANFRTSLIFRFVFLSCRYRICAPLHFDNTNTQRKHKIRARLPPGRTGSDFVRLVRQALIETVRRRSAAPTRALILPRSFGISSAQAPREQALWQQSCRSFGRGGTFRNANASKRTCSPSPAGRSGREKRPGNRTLDPFSRHTFGLLSFNWRKSARTLRRYNRVPGLSTPIAKSADKQRSVVNAGVLWYDCPT